MLDWRIPGYRTVSELARHAGGRSVLAVHEASGLSVALRYHPPVDDPVPLRTVAAALAGVRSPQVAALFEHIEVVLDGRFGAATVREYVPGAPLGRLLRHGPLEPAAGLAVLRAGLLGLAAGHGAGITHGAYTPHNLVVDRSGGVRLTDFAAHPPAPGTPILTGQSDAADTPVSTGQSAAADVRAAYGVFTQCVPKPGRKLLALAEPAQAGDGAALLAAVETAGQDGWGPAWRSRAERDLARFVARER